jgi:tRNA wybutosine-synthesizing protein 3
MFETMKKAALEKLRTARENGEVDEPALRLLDKINAQNNLFTSSSCWGRILLIDFAGKKGESKFRAKWHRAVDFSEVKEALETAEGEQLWLRAEPLIIHVSCRDIDAMKRVLDIKNAAGIKRGGVFHIGEDRIQIELEGTQRMETLVKINGKIVVDDPLLEKLVGIANERILENQKDWNELERLFSMES